VAVEGEGRIREEEFVSLFSLVFVVFFSRVVLRGSTRENGEGKV
jgi:hypothetical protein